MSLKNKLVLRYIILKVTFEFFSALKYNTFKTLWLLDKKLFKILENV